MLSTQEQDLLSQVGLIFDNPFSSLAESSRNNHFKQLTQRLGSKGLYSSNLYLTRQLIKQIRGSGIEGHYGKNQDKND